MGGGAAKGLAHVGAWKAIQEAEIPVAGIIGTSTGAIIGAVSGFAMAVATALVFVLPTGGRAIISVPPYLVITYEMTILFGVLFTLFGFHVVSGLPAWRDRPYTPESNVDRFVVVVEGADDADAARAETILREAGAEETRRVEDS